MGSVTSLNNISAQKHCDLSTTNLMAKNAVTVWHEEQVETCTADLEQWQYSGWHMFTPKSHIERLVKNGVSLCIKSLNLEVYNDLRCN